MPFPAQVTSATPRHPLGVHQSRISAACAPATPTPVGIGRAACGPPETRYHLNLDAVVKQFQCPIALTRVTGCQLNEQGLPAADPTIQTVEQALQNGFWDGYHATTMEDCCDQRALGPPMFPTQRMAGRTSTRATAQAGSTDRSARRAGTYMRAVAPSRRRVGSDARWLARLASALDARRRWRATCRSIRGAHAGSADSLLRRW